MPKPTLPTTQSPGIHHKRIGDVVVTAINDGMFEGAFSMLANFPASEAEALHQAAFRAIPPRLAINCYLIQTNNRLILVDAGFGGAIGDLAGHLADDLRAMGVAPGDIDTVLCTHLHPDHVGGLVDGAGAAVFPNAELVVHQADHRFWSDDATLARCHLRSGPRLRPTRPHHHCRLRRPNPSADVRRGASGHFHHPRSRVIPPAIPDGSSPQAAKSLLIWGDVVHMPGVQFPRPEAGMGFDVDGAAAIETRKRIMDMTATDRLMVAGMHLDFPGFGHVSRTGSGYAFIPDVWTPTV